MRKLRRATLVSALADRMLANGSWCGETHLQKAVFLLQDMVGVPTDFEFTLYKHGPYSFDLHDELAELRADEVLQLVPQHPPYGPRFVSGDAARQLRERFPKTLARYDSQIRFIAQELDAKGVVELERVATAWWVTRELNSTDVLERSKEITKLKPHVAVDDAERAVRVVDDLLARAPRADRQAA